MSLLFAISGGLMDNREKIEKTTVRNQDDVQMILIRTGEMASQNSDQLV